MPLVEVNGCQMYYELFGEENREKAPVVLIHGSTQTGQSCWSMVAPLLARKFWVIVPDCRGHGQSNNPNFSCSFKELAGDIAGLIKALGIERAHLVGHSNGGNVALVTLVEYPEVVQTAVLQAANAYVSPDLVEKEPAIFDPARVSTESPEWKQEMIRLHRAIQGEDYWQILLNLTVQEIISEPRYSSANLSKVEKPVLVIQGENDRVNAPSRHAQFIAENIPYSEQWLPSGIGHNVHEELLFPWIEKVVAFFETRGNDVDETLFRIGKDLCEDDRLSLFHVYREPASSLDTQEVITLAGEVLDIDQQRQTILRFTKKFPSPVKSEIRVLLADAPWGLVNRTVSDLRRFPSNRAERVSQILLGESIRILATESGWAYVQAQNDRYLGWVHQAAIHTVLEEEILRYQTACNAQVQYPFLITQSDPGVRSGPGENGFPAGMIPFGTRVIMEQEDKEQAVIRLPDNRLWFANTNGLLPSGSALRLTEQGIDLMLRKILAFIGIPYLWGGRTPFGYDCSGLAQTFFAFLGLQLPRDADQQFQTGVPVDNKPVPGDLLFFGETSNGQPNRRDNISHVAISLGDDQLIHANGTAWGVSVNSLNPASRSYNNWLKNNLIGTRRYL